MKIKPVFPLVCLLARMALGEELLRPFAKQSLGFDLAAVPFGMDTQTSFGATDAPVSPPPLTGTNVAWMTNALSAKYRHDYPNRVLRYGFREGRLEVVRISISAFDGVPDLGAVGAGKEVSERRKELRQIMDKIVEFKSNAQSRRKVAGFGFQYGAMCAPSLESLYLLEIEFTHILGAQPNRAGQSDPESGEAIYDPDPDHPWNRIFTAFYRHGVHFADTPAARWLGPDTVDPPFGRHPRFVLEEPLFEECGSVLDEFLRRKGADLMRDPLKRAVFQHDLWSVFDTLSGAGETPFVSSISGSARTSLTDKQERHRIILEHKLAQAIHLLALSPAEIQDLPDTYQLAIASGAFTNQADSRQFAFMPDGLFGADSGWVELLPGDTPLRHTRIVGGRSLFRAFCKLPENSRGTTILADYALASSAGRHNDPSKAVRNLRPFPPGTEFLLMREMICLDEDWRMVPTHIVESVQFRASSKGLVKPHFFAREAELSREMLFRGQQGGLKALQANEEQVLFYDSLGFMRVDESGNGPGLARFPANCEGCHQPRASGTFDFNLSIHIAKPNRSVPIDSVARWQADRGRLNLLREFAQSTSSDTK